MYLHSRGEAAPETLISAGIPETLEAMVEVVMAVADLSQSPADRAAMSSTALAHTGGSQGADQVSLYAQYLFLSEVTDH